MSDTLATEDAIGPPVERPATTRARRASLPRWLVSVLVAVAGAALAYVLRTVPVSTDPWHYVVAGMTFPADTWNAVGLTRYGMILPMIPVTRLFGAGEASFYLPAMLATGTLLGCVNWLASRFYGWVAGLAAVVLLAANSIVLVNASRFYPDIFAAAAFTGAVVAAVLARDRHDRDGRASARVVALLVGCGALVGWSWMVRETVVLAWPVVALLLLWRGRPPLRISLPAVGVPALGLLGLEMWISSWAFHDPFMRFKALSGADLAQTTNPADIPYLGQSRLHYLEIIPHVALRYADGWWMIAVGLAALAGGLLFPRRVGLFAGWFAVVLVGFLALGGVLRPETPNIRLDVARYLIFFLPPMVIAAVGFVATLAGTLWTRYAPRRGPALRGSLGAALGATLGVALLAGPVAASAQQVRSDPSYVVVNGYVLNDFRAWMAAHDRRVDVMYTDWMSDRILPTYTMSRVGERMSHVDFKALPTSREVKPGAYVVLFSVQDATCPFCHKQVTDWLDGRAAETATWKRIWTSPGDRITVFRVPRSPGAAKGS